MYGDPRTEGRGSGSQHDEGRGRRRPARGPFGEGGPARFRFGGRGEGGRGGARGESGRGAGGEGTGGGKRRGSRGHTGAFGPGGHFGPGPARGPWSRARRGDVRVAILLELADEPMHGYQIMQKLEERSGGAWRPSPGSVYPTLQLLEDQGLITGEEADGRRVFALTEAGETEAAAIKERIGDSPWAGGAGSDPRFALRQAVFALGGAVKQLGMTGSADDAQKALEILREARKKIYALLAEAE